MPSCNICIDDLSKPVSLPCGHIFCSDCIIKTIQAVKPLRNIHPCPICRSPYNIAPINPAFVPPHLRPHINPSIRRVYVDSAPQQENELSHQSSSCPKVISDEIARLRSENHTLRTHCVSWRRRAELHGAATLGLLDFARVVRDQAMNLSRQRDELQRECKSLKRKLEDRDHHHHSDHPFRSDSRPEQSQVLESSLSLFPYPQQDALSSIDASRLAISALLELRSCVPGPNSSLEPGLERSESHRPVPLSSSSSSSSARDPITDTTYSQSDLEPSKKRFRHAIQTSHSTVSPHSPCGSTPNS